MKNTLWTFGDSYTAGILPDIDHFPPYKEYLKYLGITKEEFPLGWNHQLSKKLDMNLTSCAVGGASNHETIIKLYNKIPFIKKGDIVIIQWSYMNRFLWASKEENYNFQNIIGNPFGMFKRASIHTQGNEDYGFTPTEIFKQIGVNKSLPAWVTEIHSIENLILYLSKIIGFIPIFWSTDDYIHISKGEYISNDLNYLLGNVVWDYSLREDGEADNKFLEGIRDFGVTSILQETQGQIDDKYHFGIKGNQVFSELVYNHIKKYLYN